jgi:phenylacetate-CoA ligase
MFAFSFGPFLGFWLAFEAAARLGALCLPGGGLSSAARLRVMQENGVNVLCCTPTYALRLAEVAAEEKMAGHTLGVKTIVVAGEPGGSIPATRAKLESLWPGACIFDHHGMTEVGPVTLTCPARPGVLHVIESAYYAEVIDPASGQPATRGELVLTTLTRTGSPLLRYRTGDLVKCRVQDAECRSEACDCGRVDLALEGGILGRVDDMIIVRGVNIYPSAVEEIIRGFAEVAEYRVHVSAAQALLEMRVEIEPVAGAAAAGLGARLEQMFHQAFALRVPVRVVAAGTLPRFEMKALRWVKS